MIEDDKRLVLKLENSTWPNKSLSQVTQAVHLKSAVLISLA